MLGVGVDLDVVGEVEAGREVDDFPVDVLPIVCAEGGPPYEALEHDCAQGPLPSTLSESSLTHSVRKGTDETTYPVTVK